MVTEIGGASIASQIQSATRTTEAAPKPAATPVNAEPKAEASKPAELELKFDHDVVERAAATAQKY